MTVDGPDGDGPVGGESGDGAFLARFRPTYFTASMTLGATAVGAEQLGLHVLALVLLALAGLALTATAVLVALRVIRHPAAVVDDLTHHATAFTVLTTVAAFNIVGGATVSITGWTGLGWACWAIGLLLWPPLLYASLFSTIIASPKPDLAHGINGTWFLTTVSTQTMVATTALLLTRTGANQGLELLALGGFGLGVVLYLIVMTLLFLRWVFVESPPDEDDPPSWIAAGAMATTALAGARLMALDGTYPLLTRVTPFIEGLALVGWSMATFWLPLMVAVQVWRHGVHRLPWRFSPSMWSMVYPVAVYGIATYALANVTGLDVLDPLPPIFLILALVGTVLVGQGMFRSLARPTDSSG